MGRNKAAGENAEEIDIRKADDTAAVQGRQERDNRRRNGYVRICSSGSIKQ